MLHVDDLLIRQAGLCWQWNFSLAPGELLVIHGPSGAGKTTLLETLAGLRPAAGGAVRWAGRDVLDLAPARRPFALMCQSGNLFDHLTARQNLAFGVSPTGRLSASQKVQVEAAARRFGIIEVLAQLPGELSGGQAQRVALARTFLQGKPVLLLDEPFASLDPAMREEGMRWVNQMRQEHDTAVILVTHHVSEVEADATRMLACEAASGQRDFGD